MRVSIVIPAYNSERYLGQTLRSVLAQDYDDFEVVIADHSSSDGTAAMIESFASDPRMVVLDPTPAGGGARSNWNRVSQAARGELIKLVPGDDLLHPTIVRRQVAGFDTHPSVVMSATRRSMVDATGTTLIRSRGLPGRFEGLSSGTDAIRATVRAGTNIFGEPGCVMLRRDLLEAEGWWDGTNPYLIDERSYISVLRHGNLYGIIEPLAAFRISAGQWSVRLASEQARQAAEFHNHLAETMPEVVSRTDALVGNTRARLMAQARRIAYLVLGSRRMGADSVEPSST